MGEHQPLDPEPSELEAFRRRLLGLAYSGEMTGEIAPRIVAATDNSIYQVRPGMVLYPRSGEDLNIVVRAAAAASGRIALAPRGGGTGTNGQSLTSGVVVDLSRHMNRILALDVANRTVTVEPGVVLAQLNTALAPHNLFFPPSVSTASRATLGGMVATDASGKGSRIYGKTSAWIDSLDLVLSDGSDWHVRALSPGELARVMDGRDLAARAHRVVHSVVTAHADLIRATFPNINRSLTGYNLRDIVRENEHFDLAYLFAGSEGTLALTKAITLRVAPRPKHRAVVVARYASFEAALRDVRSLTDANPSAVEILDDKILALAAQDLLWTGLDDLLGGPAPSPVQGLNIIEFVNDDLGDLEQGLADCLARLADAAQPALDWTVVRNPDLIAQLWVLREKSVGLLGRIESRRQGTAFVEDAAVPVERLVEFVTGFRAILDSHGLRYGMFGHADVGCLHVRPALDMLDPADAALIRPISDQVAALAKAHGGLIWGEHGRGYRGEYSRLFFGDELYEALERIKGAFDPFDIFNPGKLARPDGTGEITRIDEVPLKGSFDQTIDADRVRDFDRALACNGNGACYSWDISEPMCPSFKATRDRVQSPKGRAALLREWARLGAERDRGRPVATEFAAVESAAKAALDSCLSCKACSHQCPVRVDIPDMRSKFLAEYYDTKRRPVRHALVAAMESYLPLARRFPILTNRLSSTALVKTLVSRVAGLVDLPRIVPSRAARPRRAGQRRGVVLLRDSFVSTFDGGVHDAAVRLLEGLGYEVLTSPIWASGKAEHVLGMRERFARKARRAKAMGLRLSASGLPLVSLDAATGLLFEQEYCQVAPEIAAPAVIPIERFLSEEAAAGHVSGRGAESAFTYRLHLHCTERTARPHASRDWQAVFRHFGMTVSVPSLGCCGMAGMFGHEVENSVLSAQIFDLGWRPSVGAFDRSATLATGFSCRCQVDRFAGFRPRHPIEALLENLMSAQS